MSVNPKTVAKRMRLMGIEGMSPRAFAPVTTIQSTQKSTLVDLVKRLFDQGQLNRVWMTDMTYLRTGEGWLSLCVIRDGHSRRVLAGPWIVCRILTGLNAPCAWHIPCVVTCLMAWSSMRIVALKCTSNQLWHVCQGSGHCSTSWQNRCVHLIMRWLSRSGRH